MRKGNQDCIVKRDQLVLKIRVLGLSIYFLVITQNAKTRQISSKEKNDLHGISFHICFYNTFTKNKAVLRNIKIFMLLL